MLPGKIDKTKIYLKVTNKKEIHHGLQYKTGLNIDPVPFNNNPDKSCCKGGIYFTTAEFLHKFFWAGCWIREVTIPDDARVVLDPMGDKYRTNKIILGEKHNLDYYFNNIFDKKTFSEKDYYWLAEYCSNYFDQWFDKKTYPTEVYYWLAEYCPEHFHKWFDKKTYPTEVYYYLAEYCQKYKHIWE